MQLLNLKNPIRLSDETIKKMERFKDNVTLLYNDIFGEQKVSHPDVQLLVLLATEKGTGALTIGCPACLNITAMKFAQINMMGGNMQHAEDIPTLDEIQMPDDAQKH